MMNGHEDLNLVSFTTVSREKSNRDAASSDHLPKTKAPRMRYITGYSIASTGVQNNDRKQAMGMARRYIAIQ